MAAVVWSLAANSGVALAAPASAEARSINLPPASLTDSMRRLSDLTGVSIGFAGSLPTFYTRAVRHAHSAADALRQMLEGTGYRGIATGPSSFRIERAPVASARSQPPARPARTAAAAEADIVVTALKRSQPLATLPATARVVGGARLHSTTGIAGSDALAREVPALSISGLGAGRNRLFLRGIGDGPLNGFNQGSVAILLDDARLNYDAPDPDWALVDIDQVEVLEGPQGPLYGTGALGGIVKISTTKPNASHASARVSAGLSLTDGSGVSNSQSATLNVPIFEGKLAIRAVAYREWQAGWIDNLEGRSNSNSALLAGGRLAVRWLPAEDWTVDLTAAMQNRRARDSQYVDGDLGPRERPDRLTEPRDLDARLAMMTVKGPVGSLELTSITSLTGQEAVAAYDATPLAPLLGTRGPTLANDDRTYKLFDQEVRINNPRAGPLEWLAGLSFINASTHARIVAEDSVGSVPLLIFKRSVTEAAVFGNGSIAITPEVSLGGGARIFSSSVEDEGNESGSPQRRGRRTIKASGDAKILWNPTPGTTVFVRAATAYRPGGLNVEPDATQPLYEADELASVELGLRIKLASAVSLDATVFAERWQHAQTDELLANGLVATRNAGNARDVGAEGEVRWSFAPKLVLSTGFMIQSARLESTSQATAVDDPRIPAVPQEAARIRLDGGFRLGSWNGLASLGIRYVGSTHLSFDPVLDRRIRAHSTLDGSLALSRDGWTVALVGDNLSNGSADTFGFGNPYRVLAQPQRTPMRPRTVGIMISRNF